MEDGSPDFLHHLGEAIALRATWLETLRIPQLKDMLGTHRSLFESIAGTLLKKGLLREDPYDYDGGVRTILVPPDSALSDTGDNVEVSRRVAAYRRQLAFLGDGFPITLASLDLPTLKIIASLFSYIDWEGFGEGSFNPTTRALARMATTVRLGKDPLSSRVLHESQAQIEVFTKKIRDCLAELEAWQNESWKAGVRAKVLPHCAFQRAKAGEAGRAKALVIRKIFDQELPGSAWYPHLVQEILGEDHAESSVERRARLLASLAVPFLPVAAAPPINAPHRRTEIVDAIRSVAKASEDIFHCQEVLVENERGLEKRRLTLLQRIRRWIQKSQGRLDDRYYDIEYRPTPTAEAKTETIDFLKLVSEMRELRSVLAEITAAGSPGYRRIAAMNEEQLCDFLDWQLRQVRPLHRRMDGLNTLFHVMAAHERGSSPRSIKLELLAIENCMNRAEAVRRESIDRLEKDALIRKMTDAEWSAVINVNLTGAIGSVISGVGLGKGVRASMVA